MEQSVQSGDHGHFQLPHCIHHHHSARFKNYDIQILGLKLIACCTCCGFEEEKTGAPDPKNEKVVG